MEHQWKRTACPYDCPDGCGILAETDGKHLFKVKGDPEHPVTQGFLCRKMHHYEKTVHHKDRLLYPLKRTGPKGSGEFRQITWEEALEEITFKWKQILRESGGEAILPYSYSGSEHLIANKCGHAFFHYLGASQLDRTICSKGKGAGLSQIIGSTPGIPIGELSSCDYIVIWSSNVTATWLHAQAQILQAKKEGAKVILIEAYRTPSASLADEVLLVTPGTDAALALAMDKILLEEGLWDQDFLKTYTSGAEEFRDSLKNTSLPEVSALTGIPVLKIRRLAMDYANAKSPVIIMGTGMTRQGNGAMTARCVATLPAVTGAFRKPHGGLLANISTAAAFYQEAVTRPDFMKKPSRILNMNQLGVHLTDPAMDPPIRSLYVYNSNPACIAPNQALVLQGLAREDLFTVVHERFLTDTAKYADIILPADTSMEHEDLVTPYGASFVQKTEKVLDPPGECRSNWDTFCLLAKAMGFAHPFFTLTNQEIVEQVAHTPTKWRNAWSPEEKAHFDAHIGTLLPRDPSLHFCTASGKLEFLRPELPHPLPCYIPNYGGKFPLHFIIAPSVYSINSTFTEREDLMEKRGPMYLLLNPKDAADAGISSGEEVLACNDLAQVRFLAKVTEDTPSGTAVAEGVYTLSQSLGGLTCNALCSHRLTDAGNGSTFCDNRIFLKKCL